MVYSVRNSETIVSKNPLKLKRRQGTFSKKASEYMKNHKVSVQTDPSGKIVVSAIRSKI
jgi:hypothetical protein